MSRYLYKKIQNISPESLNFQHSGLKLTTLGSDFDKMSSVHKYCEKGGREVLLRIAYVCKRNSQQNSL